MKNRKILIALLSLFIVATMVSGSLAIYQASIDTVEEDFAAAKFIIDSHGDGGFFTDKVRIAPGDQVTSFFTVSNHDYHGNITETDMKLDITITLDSEIAPLTMKLYDGKTLLGTIEGGKGTITYDSVDAVFKANVLKNQTYTIICEWPSTDNDLDYQGMSASFSIDVTGTQVQGTTNQD